MTSAPALLLDPAEPGNLAQVDEVLGLGQAELHHRDEAVPSGQKLRVVLVLGQKAEGVLHAGGRVILEGGWIHAWLLSTGLGGLDGLPHSLGE